MDTVLHTQLDRVEKALTTLIDSIASYNPSIIAANDLLAADDELNNGVKQREAFSRDPLEFICLCWHSRNSSSKPRSHNSSPRNDGYPQSKYYHEFDSPG